MRPIRALGVVPGFVDCALVSGAVLVAGSGVNGIAILDNISTSVTVLLNSAHDGLWADEVLRNYLRNCDAPVALTTCRK